MKATLYALRCIGLFGRAARRKEVIEKCKWHKNDKPLENGEVAGCPNCGTMLSTKDCESCGKEFLDWEDRSFDDIIAGPYATTSGDLACMRCGPQDDARKEEAEEEDAVYFPDYDY